jgi:hypothetical protein
LYRCLLLRVERTWRSSRATKTILRSLRACAFSHSLDPERTSPAAAIQKNRGWRRVMPDQLCVADALEAGSFATFIQHKVGCLDRCGHRRGTRFGGPDAEEVACLISINPMIGVRMLAFFHDQNRCSCDPDRVALMNGPLAYAVYGRTCEGQSTIDVAKRSCDGPIFKWQWDSRWSRTSSTPQAARALCARGIWSLGF